MSSQLNSNAIPQEGKFISYDGNGGYAGYYDGRIIVYNQYRRHVESELNQYVTDLIADDLVADADDAAEARALVATRCPICDYLPGRKDGMPLCRRCTEVVYGPLPGTCQFVANVYDAVND